MLAKVQYQHPCPNKCRLSPEESKVHGRALTTTCPKKPKVKEAGSNTLWRDYLTEEISFERTGVLQLFWGLGFVSYFCFNAEIKKN